MPCMLVIRLLGPVQVLLDDRPVALKRRKSRALLYYLAAQSQPVPRRQLIGLLWPDHNDQTARHNLRTTLYALRQTLGDALVVDDEHLGLAGPVEVDARDFVATLTAADPNDDALTRSLDAYRGDFLEDFDLPDSPEFDDWLIATREQMRRLAIRGFQLRSRRAEAAGDYAAALTPLCRALTIDPFQEDLQRTGLRLHYLAGDRAGAIRRYEEFRRLLDAEMGVPPMAETRAVYDAIITDTLAIPPAPVAAVVTLTPPAAAPPTPQPAPSTRGLPFAGRDAELAHLHDLIGAGKLILVEGESGLGKTRLVETFLADRHAATASALILVGRGRELESRLPYQPVIEALRSIVATPMWPQLRPQLDLAPIWWQEVARLLPELAGPETAASAARTPDESRLWEGVHQFLLSLTQHYAVIFFLDDLHWVDSATLGLLGYLVRQTPRPETTHHAMTLLAAARPVAPRAEAALLYQSLVREDHLARLTLDRLTEAEVQTLARVLSPRFGYPLGSWLYRSSEGNPFILAELVRYARDQDILSAGGAVNLHLLPTTPVVPPTVYTLIQARLATLSEAARRVLDTAVAVGREFEFEVAARAAGLRPETPLGAGGALGRAPRGPAPAARRGPVDHSLTMEVAYHEVGELRHRLLHRRVAAALEAIHHDQLDEVAGLLAQHYAEGDQPALAAKYARRAGQRAVELAAWREAAEFFRQALQATPSAEQPGLQVALGAALLHAGDLAQAADVLIAALHAAQTDGDDAVVLEALRGLAQALTLQSRYADVGALAGEYAEYPQLAVRSMAEFMWGTSLSLEGLDLDAAARHFAAAEALTPDGAGPDSALMRCQIQFELGNLDARANRLEDAVRRYRDCLRLAADLPGDDALRWHILAENNLAYHLHLLGDPTAWDHIQAALALAGEKGMVMLLPYLLSTLGELALAQGELATAEGAFHRGLAYAQRFAHPERIAGLTANLGLVALRRGQADIAVQRLRTALDQADAIPSRFLAAQIRLWLAPLLPPDAARPLIAAARDLIAAGNYDQLAPLLAAAEAAHPA